MLILESELNRAQLLRELDGLMLEFEHLAAQARSVGSLASSAVSLCETLLKVQQFLSDTKAKFPRVFEILKAARTGASMWSTLRRWLG